MSNLDNLEDIIDNSEPNATFHDADIHSILVDYQNSALTIRMTLCVGDPNAKIEIDREIRRQCEVVFDGLRHWTMEFPSPISQEIKGPLWMTSDGQLKDCPTDYAKALIKSQLPYDIQWYLYFSDLNTFAYIVATNVSFKWVSS
jgi:hypothetical protein